MVDKLTSTNYSTWKFKLKHLLIAKDLYDYCDGTIAEPADGANEDVKKAYTTGNRKALSHIVLTVSDELIYLITECESPKAAWDKLSSHFERDTLANRIYLKKQYFRAVMKDGESIEKHLKHMKDIVNKLAAIKAPVSEEDQVVTLLGSMPTSYSTVVTALEAQQPETLTLEFVQNALLNEEQKRGGQRGPGIPGGSSGRTSASSDTALFADRESKSERRCYNCNSSDHMIRNCPTKPQRQFSNSGRGRGRGRRGARGDTGNSNHKAAAATSDDEGEEFAFAVGEPTDAVTEWLIDSGATRHMAPNRDRFSTYTRFDQPEKVTIADGRVVDAIGTGNIRISASVSRKVNRKGTLHDVLHVPDLKQNLFSVKSATSRDLIIQFGHTRCWIKNKRSQIHAMGTLVNKLYYLDLVDSDHRACKASCNDIWHQRLAHAGHTTIRRANSESLVTGADLSDVSTSICEPCVKGKMARKPYKPVGGIKSQRVLELVHTDVCGPMQNNSIGGSRYFVSFIDDYSRYAHVFFVSNKSDVFSVFQEYKAAVENKTGHRIKTLRSDRGGEYMSNEFSDYLKSNGIQHQVTVRCTPEQNGVSERYNRTVCESARAMIIDAQLPKSFWAEAVSTAVYVRNRLPTTSHQLPSTPYELWNGHKPDIGNLRVFGSLAYAHIPDELRQKLDAKAEAMVHVGYSLLSKAYRLYDPASQKIVVRRDVIFDESKLGLSKSDEQATTDKHGELTVTLDQSSPLNDESTEPRRSNRVRQPITRYGIDEYCSSVEHRAFNVGDIIEPDTFKAAQQSPQSTEWIKATDGEYQSLMDNETWELVELPPGRKAINSKWVFKAKYRDNGEIERFKSRLVAKGYSQQPGIDYTETFAPVVKYSSVRAILSYGLSHNMIIHQMDVVTAFLNGKLEEEIYMRQPEGYIKPGSENLVCRLNKSLYGLKQSPRCWNSVLNSYLLELSFKQSDADPCIYIKNANDTKIVLAVYVDDLIIMTDTESDMTDIKHALESKFKMKDLGELHYCLGITVERDRSKIQLNQKFYLTQVLARFGMLNANPVSTPADCSVKLQKNDNVSKPVDASLYQAMVGSLLYASIATRPDIAHAVGEVSKYNSNPTEAHLTAVKRILRYVKGTIDLKLTYTKPSNDIIAVGYTDANWAGDIDDRHSTSGYVFTLADGAISWLSKRQPVVATSTAEAEYIALYLGTQESIALKRLLLELSVIQKDEPVKLMTDSQSAIAIAKNTSRKTRAKHIDIKFHFVREALLSNEIALEYCASADMTADILTKPINREQFIKLRSQMGLIM